LAMGLACLVDPLCFSSARIHAASFLHSPATKCHKPTTISH
jgi:hypothetical protein